MFYIFTVRMTARIILTIKFLLIWVYTFALSPTAKMVILTTGRQPPEAVFWFFIGMMWLPEIVICFSYGFREWIRQGIENADGKLNSKDVKDLLVHYASLTSMKLFVLESLLMMFYDVTIPFQYYVIPFFGSVGLSGFAIFKNLYKEKI